MTSRKERKPAGSKGRTGKGASGADSSTPEARPRRRDTPRDRPGVGAGEEKALVPTGTSPVRPEAPSEPSQTGGASESVIRGALARVRELETLESAYDAWLELRLAHGAARLRFQEEHERLEQQGSFLVGAVRAASQERTASTGTAPDAESALASVDGPMRDFLRQAEEKLGRAREALAKDEAESEARYQSAFEEIRSTVRDRVRRYLAASPPRLRLLLRKVGATRAILHVERVSGDAPVLLLYLFAGCIPSRHGFLFDDSTEDVSLPPAPLYPEEGVASDEVRPEASVLGERVRARSEVLPVKGFLPVFVPRPEGGEDFFRLLQRGPVMEVEVAEGSGFRSILSREESERFAGHLLRLKLEGRLELEVEAG